MKMGTQILRWIIGKKKRIEARDAEEIEKEFLGNRQRELGVELYVDQIYLTERASTYEVSTEPYKHIPFLKIDIETGEVLGVDNITPLQAQYIAESEMKGCVNLQESRIGNWDQIINVRLKGTKYIFIFGPTHPEIKVEISIRGLLLTPPRPTYPR